MSRSYKQDIFVSLRVSTSKNPTRSWNIYAYNKLITGLGKQYSNFKEQLNYENNASYHDWYLCHVTTPHLSWHLVRRLRIITVKVLIRVRETAPTDTPPATPEWFTNIRPTVRGERIRNEEGIDDKEWGVGVGLDILVYI